MYSNTYQSCSFIELYNAQKKESKRQWKTSGPVVVEFDPILKGYVLSLINGGVSKIHIPKSDKVLLGIVQPCIVFQIYIYSIKSLAIEVSISDVTKIHRRFLFSSAIKEITINPLHCKVPIPCTLPSGKWINISLDVSTFNNECFKNQAFRSIDMVSITGNCRIRKVFSMKFPLLDSGSDTKNILLKSNNFNSDLEIESINKFIGLPNEVPIENINLNFDKIKSIFTLMNDNRGSSPKTSKKNTDLLSNNFIDGNIISPFQKQYYVTKNSPVFDKISNTMGSSKGVPSINSKILFNNKNRMVNILSKKSETNILIANENSMKPKSKSPEKNKIFSPKKHNNITKNETIQNLAKQFIVGSMVNSSMKREMKSENLLKSKENSNNLHSKKHGDEKFNIVSKFSLSDKKPLESLNNILGVGSTIKKEENLKDEKDDENYYKFDEKDFSTHNSQEDENHKKDCIQNDSDDKEDCIDEHISVESENSNILNENILKENTNNINQTNDLITKPNVNSKNWNFAKDHNNKIMNYVNVFGNRQITSILTPPYSKFTSSRLKTTNFNIKESNELDSSNKIRSNKHRLLANKDEQQLDLIYDHVLGCYYDPNTEIYYELEEK